MKQETKTTIIDAMNAHFDAIARKQQPQDTSTRKDELDITKRKWYFHQDLIWPDGAIVTDPENDEDDTITICNFMDEPDDKRNAEIICTAVNSTYGKGYNPAAMEELYKALEKCQYQLQTWVESDAWSMDDEEAYEVAQTALNNAKL